MTNAIGYIKPACDRHKPAQVLDSIEFSKPC